MRAYKEFELENFEAWSGAVDTKNTIIEKGKAEDVDYLLDEIFPDGATETEVNDFLWFEPETVFEMLGIETEEEE